MRLSWALVMERTSVIVSMLEKVLWISSSSWSLLSRFSSTMWSSFSRRSISFRIPPILAFRSSREIRSSVYISMYFCRVRFSLDSLSFSSLP